MTSTSACKPWRELRGMHVVALILASGLILPLFGCSESPLGTDKAEAHSGVDAEGAFLRAEKQRHAVDLGSPTGSPLSLWANSSMSTMSATAASIPFAPEPGPFANSAGLICDDCTREGLPIGFEFTFYGETYTTFNVSSNGFIGFTEGMSNGCCSGGQIPGADAVNNIIAAAWTDLYPAGGGGVFYETRGRAPTRYLVVAFQNLPWCCETGTNRVTSQIILYEGSNRVEIHTTNQSPGHTYTQGVEDPTGTEAAFIPGRVAANYGLANDAVRFTTEFSWAARAPLPSARRGLAVGAANNLVYAIGGVNNPGTVLRTVQAYNPSTNAWSNRASLPAPRQTGNGTATINNILYLAGGHDAAGGVTRTLYAYNPSTNTWSTKAQMPVFSSCGGSAPFAGKLYVYSGCTRTSTGGLTAAAMLHRYDPATNRWATLRPPPAIHVHPVVAVTSGKLYVVGGNNGTGGPIGRVDMYDPGTNTWVQKTSMPTARVFATGTSIGGKLYVFGGRTGTTYQSIVEVYDPISNSWASRIPMPTARAALGVGGVSGSLYLIGGRNHERALTANERFTP